MTIKIDLDERFKVLAKAPIIEATVDIRAVPEVPWEETAITQALKAKLPDYPTSDSEKVFQHEVSMGPGKPPEQKLIDLGWSGVRFWSNDRLCVAVFSRDGLRFGRLAPYESWDKFSGEALRLWNIFYEIAKPKACLRLGLRFINRIALPPGVVKLEDYLHVTPKAPSNLDIPCKGFLHHDVLTVPEYRYDINVIRTIQPLPPPTTGNSLILDIDAFTSHQFMFGDDILVRKLREMRWLKNKVFFGSITPELKGILE